MNEKKAKLAPRESMPEQPAGRRVGNFDEVALGYTAEQARAEAARCMQCRRPKCVEGCPVQVDIPAFLAMIADGKFVEAAQRIKETNCLPAICGRVCPQETQCEGLCVLDRRGEPVAIGALERFAADYEREQGVVALPEKAPSSGKRVAVVGSGPAGLTAAGDLIRMGHAVTIFEAFHEAGGVLAYGIPEFRLPKRIVADEVRYLRRLGVSI